MHSYYWPAKTQSHLPLRNNAGQMWTQDTCYAWQVMETCQQKHSEQRIVVPMRKKTPAVAQHPLDVRSTFKAEITATCEGPIIKNSSTSEETCVSLVGTQHLIYNNERYVTWQVSVWSLAMCKSSRPLALSDSCTISFSKIARKTPVICCIIWRVMEGNQIHDTGIMYLYFGPSKAIQERQFWIFCCFFNYYLRIWRSKKIIYGGFL